MSVTTAVSAQRLAVLVDVQNIYYPAKSMGDKVNFQSLLKRFQSRQLIRAIAYVVEAPDVDVSPFVIALRNIGFEVRTKSVKVFEDGTRKGDIHLMLALDAMSLAEKLDAVCLVTGDGEYVDLIHLLRSRGVRVEVMSFKSNTSAELLRACDEHIPMNEEFLLGYSGPAGGREERFPDRGRSLERTRPLGYGYRERGGDGARGGDGRESRSGVAVRRDERYERYSGRPHRADSGWRGDDRFLREGRELREPTGEPEEATEE